MTSAVVVHHLHFCCKDPKTVGRWFVEILGAKELGDAKFFGGATGVLLDLAGTNLFIRGPRPGEQLSDDTSPERFGFDHIGLRVNDIDQLASFMKAKQVKFEVDVHEFRPGTRVAFVTGPENIRIELSESKPAAR